MTTFFEKNLNLRGFKSDWDEIWQDCSSSKYASIDGTQNLLNVDHKSDALITIHHQTSGVK